MPLSTLIMSGIVFEHPVFSDNKTKVGKVMRILDSSMLAKDDVKDLFAPKQETKIDDGGWPMLDFMYN
jgi:hypothetical protein